MQIIPEFAIQKALRGERIDALACRRARPTAGQENRPLSDGRFSVFSREKRLKPSSVRFPLCHQGTRAASMSFSPRLSARISERTELGLRISKPATRASKFFT